MPLVSSLRASPATSSLCSHGGSVFFSAPSTPLSVHYLHSSDPPCPSLLLLCSVRFRDVESGIAEPSICTTDQAGLAETSSSGLSRPHCSTQLFIPPLSILPTRPHTARGRASAADRWKLDTPRDRPPLRSDLGLLTSALRSWTHNASFFLNFYLLMIISVPLAQTILKKDRN